MTNVDVIMKFFDFERAANIINTFGTDVTKPGMLTVSVEEMKEDARRALTALDKDKNLVYHSCRFLDAVRELAEDCEDDPNKTCLKLRLSAVEESDEFWEDWRITENEREHEKLMDNYHQEKANAKAS